MDEQWVPLSARERPNDSFASLHDGIPVHMAKSLTAWLTMMLTGGGLIRMDVLLEFERRSRLPLPPLNEPNGPLRTVVDHCFKSHEWALDLVDFLLRFAVRQPSEPLDLAAILTQSGSMWKVTGEERVTESTVFGSTKKTFYRLERRVSEQIVSASQEVMNSSGRAGQHLRKAWSLVYDRQPSPNDAFLEAVRAVEAAMVPVVTPNDGKATLGRMLNALTQQPSGRIVVDMAPEPNSIDPLQLVHSMCQLLWKAQPERHGTPEERTRSNVSQKSAEGAVHLAVMLVQWFTSGVVRRQ